ncbi:hypothetical protein H2204_003165 [Knufia peltigerae]|uniref:Xylanolytic transcriptional activator regulatory domain-containing protein n=1 Tax=Knufia peltigerae TaxID=1002370 RepID=A0AA38YBK4_9EURO|nr:hypothetical protein H2204_003165 [Knufia peltigerae]
MQQQSSSIGISQQDSALDFQSLLLRNGPLYPRPASSTDPNIFSPPSAPAGVSKTLDLDEHGPVRHQQQQCGSAQRRRRRQQQPHEVSPSEHAVHAVIGATVDEENRDGFFGNSSAGTFMQHVKKVVLQKVGATQQQPSRASLVHEDFSPPRTLPASGHTTKRPEPVDYVLPTRRKADSLVSAYWRYVHVLYPYLDKLEIEGDYERLWKSDEGNGSIIADERAFMCLLNAMFALASQFDEQSPIEERQRSGHVFCTRARELSDIVETGTIRSVQSFLILGQYFQSTSEPHSCWIFVGLAVRTAQSLGLNWPETSERCADIKTRELLRKTWHACVLMDRTLSMTYGRPCMIGQRAASVVPLPLPFDEEHLCSAGSSQVPSPPGQRHQNTASAEFFVLSLRLFEILHDVIFHFYSVNHLQEKSVDNDRYFGSSSNSQASVFEIERRISKWERDLPQHLRVGGTIPQNDGAAAATLHRQADGASRDIPLGDLLSHKVLLQCAVICVKTALQAIDTIYEQRGNEPGDVGFCAAWWYNVLYLYTSATVLIAARLSSDILAEFSEQLILEGWRRALEALRGYSHFGASIQRLVTTLRLLYEAVPQQYSRFKENPRQTQPDYSASTFRDPGEGTTRTPAYYSLDFSSAAAIANETSRGHLPQDEMIATTTLDDDTLLDFDAVFDPNDLSWLMTIPLDS